MGNLAANVSYIDELLMPNKAPLSSQQLSQRAQSVMPGGVNSPVRAFKNLGLTPLWLTRGEGAYVYDIEQQRYIDYVCTWGANILGHAAPEITTAIQKQAACGTSFGAPHPSELALAEQIQLAMPKPMLVRLMNSGTEATMTAIRLARAYTGRQQIVKFAGSYHGHSDSLLVDAGSGGSTYAIPTSAGLLGSTVTATQIIPFNDSEALQQVFATHGPQLAAIIVEPIMANHHLVLPKPQFLQEIRALCEQYGTVCIFDEVITGFRVAWGGAQAYYQVAADLCCLGKIIGGGLPVGALAGKQQLMQQLAPLGSVYHAGTLAGNPLSSMAGTAVLEILQQQPQVYQQLADASCYLAQHLQALFHQYHYPVQVTHVPGLFGMEFLGKQAEANFRNFFTGMLHAGIYLAPSRFEVGFLTLAHTKEVLDATLNAAERVIYRCSA